jgi:hypothetical protein
MKHEDKMLDGDLSGKASVQEEMLDDDDDLVRLDFGEDYGGCGDYMDFRRWFDAEVLEDDGEIVE